MDDRQRSYCIDRSADATTEHYTIDGQKEDVPICQYLRQNLTPSVIPCRLQWQRRDAACCVCAAWNLPRLAIGKSDNGGIFSVGDFTIVVME